ncbi:MAG: 2Fe-2S iron-sulfur cluster-binding protein, partial [Candidatus Aminicenantales bacterium]
MSEIRFTIDGKACLAERGLTIVEAAKANGVYIPVLCN